MTESYSEKFSFLRINGSMGIYSINREFFIARKVRKEIKENAIIF